MIYIHTRIRLYYMFLIAHPPLLKIRQYLYIYIMLLFKRLFQALFSFYLCVWRGLELHMWDQIIPWGQRYQTPGTVLRFWTCWHMKGLGLMSSSKVVCTLTCWDIYSASCFTFWCWMLSHSFIGFLNLANIFFM